MLRYIQGVLVLMTLLSKIRIALQRIIDFQQKYPTTCIIQNHYVYSESLFRTR